MPKTAPLRLSSPGVDGPPATLAGLLREWLPGQRWFAGKDRPVADLDVLSTTELFPGCLHLLVHAAHTGAPAPGGTPRPATATNSCWVYGNTSRRASPGPSSAV